MREHGVEPSLMIDSWHHWPEDFTKDVRVRGEFIQTFGFAILTKKAIEAMSPHAPLLELGAGSGYWSYELRRHGVDVIATDPATEEFGHFEQDPKRWTKHWTDVEKLDAVEAIARYPGFNLLIVWPSLSDPWAANALEAFSGDTVIYVGEGKGGCTADDDFHEILDVRFPNQETIDIPVFFGIHDSLIVAKRNP